MARRFGRLIRRRIECPAFHPQAKQIVHGGHAHVFAVCRVSEAGRRVLALTNVTDREQVISISCDELGATASWWRDLLSHRRVAATRGSLDIRLPPYAVQWLTPERDP